MSRQHPQRRPILDIPYDRRLVKRARHKEVRLWAERNCQDRSSVGGEDTEWSWSGRGSGGGWEGLKSVDEAGGVV